MAIMESNGFFLTGLDDDDHFTKSNKISRYVSAWNATNSDIAGLFDSALLRTADGLSLRSAMPSVGYRDLLISNYIGNQVFAPKTHYMNAGLFDPDMPAWQDWDLWIRMARHYGIFKNISLCGTVIDESHSNGRISTLDQNSIRAAMRNLVRKLSPLTIREKSYLVSALHAYPQVKPTLIEVLTIIAALRLKSSIGSAKKLLSIFRSG